jgi:8-oxo-dGTP pyrophosphatase MutT (NUDIX family)
MREKSCGSIIYKKENGNYKFLIAKMKLGHFSFCKGHQEKGENDRQTAIREVKEESNLDIEIIDGFFESISFYPKLFTKKYVYYFLSKALSFNLKCDDREIDSLYWLSYSDAFDKLTFKNDKGLLEKAYNFMLKKNL